MSKASRARQTDRERRYSRRMRSGLMNDIMTDKVNSIVARMMVNASTMTPEQEKSQMQQLTDTLDGKPTRKPHVIVGGHQRMSMALAAAAICSLQKL